MILGSWSRSHAEALCHRFYETEQSVRCAACGIRRISAIGQAALSWMGGQSLCKLYPLIYAICTSIICVITIVILSVNISYCCYSRVVAIVISVAIIIIMIVFSTAATQVVTLTTMVA